LLCNDGNDLVAEIDVAQGVFHQTPSLVFLARKKFPPGEDPISDAATVSGYGKLDALGIISQGMGHEINNPLQVILSSAELALVLNKNPDVVPLLQEIIGSAERVKEAILSLRNFAQPDAD
jgi:signal transduction histidine kinase